VYARTKTAPMAAQIANRLTGGVCIDGSHFSGVSRVQRSTGSGLCSKRVHLCSIERHSFVDGVYEVLLLIERVLRQGLKAVRLNPRTERIHVTTINFPNSLGRCEQAV